MTDITDQDRRDARQWAEAIGRSDAPCAADLWHAASRVILATVEVPPTALADELRHIAEHWEEWQTATITSAIRAAADRAEQTEQERDHFFREVENVRNWKEQLLNERDEARAEVERLTAERLDRNPETKARVKAALHNLDNAERVAVATVAPEENVAPDQQANTQGILAGSPPDPADVKPGEAWIVECRGERRTAVKGRADGMPWNTIDANGRHVYKRNKNVTLVSRLVPAPRVITDPDDLDALATRTVILSTDGQADVYQKDGNGEWLDVSSHGYSSQQVIRMENAVTVLW